MYCISRVLFFTSQCMFFVCTESNVNAFDAVWFHCFLKFMWEFWILPLFVTFTKIFLLYWHHHNTAILPLIENLNFFPLLFDLQNIVMYEWLPTLLGNCSIDESGIPRSFPIYTGNANSWSATFGNWLNCIGVICTVQWAVKDGENADLGFTQHCSR